MHLRALAVALGLLLLLLVVPQPALAQSPFSVSGFIISIQGAQAAFVLQDFRTGTMGSAWTVHVTAGIDTRRPDGGTVRGPQATFYLLRVGDMVDVQGWVIGGNQVVATSIVARPVFGDDWRSRNNGRHDDDDDDDDDRQITVAGTIANLDDRGQGVVSLREQTFATGSRLWTIRLHPHTRVEGLAQNRGWDVQVGRGGRAALRLLRVGDYIEVRGRMHGRGQIRAQLIRVRAQAGTPIPFPTPSPYPNPYPFPAQTVILAPTQGTEISASEFSVVGQTMPGAQVRIEVTARFGVFNLPVTNGTVTANQSGFFTFTVRPSVRMPGAVYTITATATYQGYTAPPVTVTVRQQ